MEEKTELLAIGSERSRTALSMVRREIRVQVPRRNPGQQAHRRDPLPQVRKGLRPPEEGLRRMLRPHGRNRSLERRRLGNHLHGAQLRVRGPEHRAAKTCSVHLGIHRPGRSGQFLHSLPGGDRSCETERRHAGPGWSSRKNAPARCSISATSRRSSIEPTTVTGKPYCFDSSYT